MSQQFYDEAGRQETALHRGFVNKKGANHLEPLFWFNDKALAAYTPRHGCRKEGNLNTITHNTAPH